MTGYKTITIKDDTYLRLSNLARMLKTSRAKTVEIAIEEMDAKNKEDKNEFFKDIHNMVKDVVVPYDAKASDLDVTDAYFD